MKYAVKYPFNDEYLYVIHGDSKFQLRPILFDSIEEAADLADVWGEDAIVVTVNIEDSVYSRSLGFLCQSGIKSERLSITFYT